MEHSATSQKSTDSTEIIRAHSRTTQTPILALKVSHFGLEEGSKDFIESLVSGGGIDVRVDWNGDSTSLGRIDVRVDQEHWQQCPNIEISTMNDLISPREIPAASPLALRVVRGPEHPDRPFLIKLIPITWQKEHEPSAVMPPTYTAERGVDYRYRDDQGPDNYPWLSSNSDSGTHRVETALTTGQAYEMHVRLQDPGNPERWLELDPIVRNDHGGSN